MFSSNKFRAISFLVALVIIFVGLTTGWVSAAQATESSADVAFPDMTCVRKPLLQGKVGETVLVCTSVRVGVTTVTHMGARS